ncbi:MAG: hypothetical protein WD009_03055 [Phycisphaeraceae bacterium]
MSTIIEFMGLLGGGKSTVARGLADRLERRGYTCRMRPRIDDWILRSDRLRRVHEPAATRVHERLKPAALALDAATHPRVYASVLALTATCRPLNAGERLNRARRLLGWARQTRALGRLAPDDALILDEGLMHHLWPIIMIGGAYRDRVLQAAARALARQPRRIIVRVRTDPDTALARIRCRAGLGPEEPCRLWLHHRATPAEARALMHRLAECDRLAAEAIRTARLASRLIEIDTDADPGDNAEHLAELIEPTLAEQRRGAGSAGGTRPRARASRRS